jgi:hypothetical protein
MGRRLPECKSNALKRGIHLAVLLWLGSGTLKRGPKEK